MAKNLDKIKVFVCTENREEGKSCGELTAKTLARNLNKICNEKWYDLVDIKETSCLGKCSQGVAVKIMAPDKTMSQHLVNEIEDILNSIENLIERFFHEPEALSINSSSFQSR